MLTFFIGPPFVPTTKRKSEEMIDLASITKKDVIYDLGSGDGRLLILAAKKGAKAVGYELNPYLALWTMLIAYKEGVYSLVTVHMKNFHQADLTIPSVLYLYALPKDMLIIQDKLRKKRKSPLLIISNTFAFSSFDLVKKTSSDLLIYRFHL